MLTPTPSYPPPLWCGGKTHSLGEEGVGVNSLEDARHCSVLYIRKYFVTEGDRPPNVDLQEKDQLLYYQINLGPRKIRCSRYFRVDPSATSLVHAEIPNSFCFSCGILFFQNQRL
jgi:hypothetical protein